MADPEKLGATLKDPIPVNLPNGQTIDSLNPESWRAIVPPEIVKRFDEGQEIVFLMMPFRCSRCKDEIWRLTEITEHQDFPCIRKQKGSAHEEEKKKAKHLRLKAASKHK